MAFTYTRLLEGTTLTNSLSSPLITNPAGKTKYIRAIVLCNYHATDSSQVKLFNVPDNSLAIRSASAQYQIFGTWSGSIDNIDAGQTVILEFPAPGLMLKDQNDTFYGSSSVSSAVSIQIFGAEE
jgi:hypothetical protein